VSVLCTVKEREPVADVETLEEAMGELDFVDEIEGDGDLDSEGESEDVTSLLNVGRVAVRVTDAVLSRDSEIVAVGDGVSLAVDVRATVGDGVGRSVMDLEWLKDNVSVTVPVCSSVKLNVWFSVIVTERENVSEGSLDHDADTVIVFSCEGERFVSEVDSVQVLVSSCVGENVELFDNSSLKVFVAVWSGDALRVCEGLKLIENVDVFEKLLCWVVLGVDDTVGDLTVRESENERV
jgi:hypothetical protein